MFSRTTHGRSRSRHARQDGVPTSENGVLDAAPPVPTTIQVAPELASTSDHMDSSDRKLNTKRSFLKRFTKIFKPSSPSSRPQSPSPALSPSVEDASPKPWVRPRTHSTPSQPLSFMNMDDEDLPPLPTGSQPYQAPTSLPTAPEDANLPSLKKKRSNLSLRGLGKPSLSQILTTPDGNTTPVPAIPITLSIPPTPSAEVPSSPTSSQTLLAPSNGRAHNTDYFIVTPSRASFAGEDGGRPLSSCSSMFESILPAFPTPPTTPGIPSRSVSSPALSQTMQPPSALKPKKSALSLKLDKPKNLSNIVVLNSEYVPSPPPTPTIRSRRGSLPLSPPPSIPLPMPSLVDPSKLVFPAPPSSSGAQLTPKKATTPQSPSSTSTFPSLLSPLPQASTSSSQTNSPSQGIISVNSTPTGTPFSSPPVSSPPSTAPSPAVTHAPLPPLKNPFANLRSVNLEHAHPPGIVHKDAGKRITSRPPSRGNDSGGSGDRLERSPHPPTTYWNTSKTARSRSNSSTLTQASLTSSAPPQTPMTPLTPMTANSSTSYSKRGEGQESEMPRRNPQIKALKLMTSKSSDALMQSAPHTAIPVVSSRLVLDPQAQAVEDFMRRLASSNSSEEDHEAGSDFPMSLRMMAASQSGRPGSSGTGATPRKKASTFGWKKEHSSPQLAPRPSPSFGNRDVIHTNGPVAFNSDLLVPGVSKPLRKMTSSPDLSSSRPIRGAPHPVPYTHNIATPPCTLPLSVPIRESNTAARPSKEMDQRDLLRGFPFPPPRTSSRPATREGQASASFEDGAISVHLQSSLSPGEERWSRTDSEESRELAYLQ